jgi:drug/metabolite transporter (DMT)-like permease
MLAAASFAALAMIALRRVGPNESPEAIALHFSIVSGSAMWLIALPTAFVPSEKGILLMLATGLFGGFAQLAQTRAYSLEPAARVGVFGYAGVVFTQVLAVVILGETLSWNTVFGSVLVIGAGLGLARASASASASAAHSAR